MKDFFTKISGLDNRHIQKPLIDVDYRSQECYRMTYREWLSYEPNHYDIIINSSSADGRDTFSYLPIGVQYAWFDRIYTRGLSISLSPLNTKLITLSGSSNSDDSFRWHQDVSRSKIFKSFESCDWVSVGNADYFSNLCAFKYVFSPEGNGIDCHRHYEAWLTKTIPIIESREICKKKFRDLPVLWTRDYSEVTESFLEDHYASMCNSSMVYDFSFLFFSSYPKEAKNLLRSNGAHWISRFSAHEVDFLSKNLYNN